MTETETQEIEQLDNIDDAKEHIRPIIFAFANIETMSVILNILNHCKGTLPEEITNLGHLLDGTQLYAELYSAIGNANFILSEDLITDMLDPDSDLALWISNTVIEAYIKVHADMLRMYMDNWEMVKESIKTFTPSNDGE